MTLSARDRRIIAAIEQGVEEHDPQWSQRFTRRAGALERVERRRLRLVRHHVLGTLLAAACIVLLCVDEAHGLGPWLWAASATTGAALALAVGRRHLHRHH